MDTLLLKMAQHASHDNTLMASLIQVHAQQHNLTWAQVAAELTLDEEQLTRLALCRRPNGHNTEAEVQQIAAYVDMSSAELTTFIRRTAPQMATAVPRPPKPHRRRSTFSWPTFHWETKHMFKRRTIAFALAAIAFMVFAAFAFAQPTGSEATLVVSAGQATVTQGQNLFLIVPRQTETTVATGSILTVNQGDRITVPAGSSAHLSLYDGSVVEIAGGSTLELSELITNDRTYRVQLSLAAGRTLNRVVKLLGADDAFEVRTPSSTASVRGTIFTVAVISNTESYIAVDEGIVRVTMGGEFIDVHPGEAVTAVVGQPLTIMGAAGETPANPVNAPAAPANLRTPEPPTATPTPVMTPTATITPTATATTTLTPTATIPPTATITGTVPGPTMTPAPTDCVGADPQPTGVTLAQTYGVAYEEIMGWFCAGFGFGTIDLAYSLSQETGTNVAVIFTMNANGMGWGQIRDQLLGNPGGNSGNPGGNSGNPGGNSGNPGGNGNNGNNGNGGQPTPEPPPPPPPPPENPPGNDGGNNGNNGNGNNGNNGNGGNK